MRNIVNWPSAGMVLDLAAVIASASTPGRPAAFTGWSPPIEQDVEQCREQDTLQDGGQDEASSKFLSGAWQASGSVKPVVASDRPAEVAATWTSGPPQQAMPEPTRRATKPKQTLPAKEEPVRRTALRDRKRGELVGAAAAAKQSANKRPANGERAAAAGTVSGPPNLSASRPQSFGAREAALSHVRLDQRPSCSAASHAHRNSVGLQVEVAARAPSWAAMAHAVKPTKPTATTVRGPQCSCTTATTVQPDWHRDQLIARLYCAS